MRALKRRMNHKNPNVQLLALSVRVSTRVLFDRAMLTFLFGQLIDICIKNGGDHFLVEVASREHMDNLVSILKMPTLNFEVKNKLLRLIQNWAVAFEGKPTLGYVGQVYKTLKNEGIYTTFNDWQYVALIGCPQASHSHRRIWRRLVQPW